MKIKTVIALAILAAGIASSALAVPPELTVTFSGYQWNDGGTLNGTFTVILDGSGNPTSLVSCDVTTGTGTMYSGYEYIYNDPAAGANTIDTTVNPPSFDAIQNDGAAANELVMFSPGCTRAINLDWQGSVNTTALYAGSTLGLHSSELVYAIGGQRDLIAVPEPNTLALAGLGGLGLLLRRRK